MKTELSQPNLGLVALIISALFMSASSVFIGYFATLQTPVLVSFSGFFLTASTFWILTIGKPAPHWDKRSLGLIIGVNTFTAIVFLSFYLSLKYLEPSLASAVQAGTAPLTAVIVGAAHDRSLKHLGNSTWSVWLIFIGVTLTAFTAMSGRSGLQTIDGSAAAVGVLLALSSGIATYFLTVLLKELSVIGWNTLQILKYRFIGIVVISLFILIFTRDITLEIPSTIDAISFLVACLIFITLPLFFLQVGISRASVLTVLVSINLVPVATFFLQLADGRLAFSAWSIAAASTTSTGIVLYLSAQFSGAQGR